MTGRAYRRPPWLMRAVGNRLAPLNAKLVATLTVAGRSTGRPRTTPVVVLEHDGERYLMAPFGHTDWALNLRAAGTGRLTRAGKAEDFTAEEVPADQRPALIEAYLSRYGKMPRVAASFRELSDPGDHPTFHILPARAD
jgi:deazaflavin-dependent oxidoreductase (nitroreductase family)